MGAAHLTEHKSPRSTSAQHKWKVWHSINQRTTQKEDKQKRVNQLTTIKKIKEEILGCLTKNYGCLISIQWKVTSG
jgi:hypothetical protein